MLRLKNSYLQLPEKFYQVVKPASIPLPEMILFNHSLANEIDLDLEGLDEVQLAHIFSGQTPIENTPAIALNYAGFQFGQPVAQLGDGRAHLLGESSGFDIQLKGSGPTPFSRQGDGKSALGPVLREYILSEAMNHLGIPTTRALCAVRTGETILRQNGPEPGGIFTRIAESHLRVGSFQYFSFRNDIESIKSLLEYSINRHYPELETLTVSEKAMGLLKSLTQKQGDLIAAWSAQGFIHGVMNTDNFSIAGITIDYGPCAFMEEFAFHKVFSSIDHNGRYSFFNQVPIAKWNILRLADCLLPLIHSNSTKAIRQVEEELLPLFSSFERKRSQKFAKKLGIVDYQEQDNELVMQFLRYLEDHNLDFHLAFYHLPDLYAGDYSFYQKSKALENFLAAWKQRVPHLGDLQRLNPLYIPRNHLVQKAIIQSYQGDDSYFHQLNKVLSQPFHQQANAEEFSIPAKPEERVYQTFCGT